MILTVTSSIGQLRLPDGEVQLQLKPVAGLERQAFHLVVRAQATNASDDLTNSYIASL
jgi:hypothetical protein